MPLGMCANMLYIYITKLQCFCALYLACALHTKKVKINHKLMMIKEDGLTPRKPWRNF